MLAPRHAHQEITGTPAFIRGEKPQAQGERPPVASFHPTSGYIYGRTSNLFKQMQEDKFAHRCAHNVYYPFKDQAEWELGQFLCRHIMYLLCPILHGHPKVKIGRVSWASGW